MTEGISKERLIGLMENPNCDSLDYAIYDYLLSLCTELDPWLPIDANTPKDKPIHLFYPYNNRQLIYQYKEQNWWGLYVEFDYQHPTHYKLLPEDPK